MARSRPPRRARLIAAGAAGATGVAVAAVVLNQIQATIRRGMTSGQIRQDVGVDLTDLLQPVQTELAAGNTAGVSQLAATLKAKHPPGERDRPPVGISGSAPRSSCCRGSR